MASTLDAVLAKYTASGNDTNDKLLGASFIVVNKDGTLYSNAAGRIDFPLEARPWSLDTFTFVASLTKVITSTAVMQLVEQGRLGLDDDMRKIVPELGGMQILRGFDENDKPILEDNTKPITLRMLLTHTVGLGYDLMPDLLQWSKSIGRTVTNLSGTLKGFETPLMFTPGEGWYYGTAIDWAGQALERVTGTTLGAYLSEHVFGPLGMRDTGFWPEKLPHVAERTAAFQIRGGDGSSLAPGANPRTESPDAIDSGGAGLWTTAQDYSVFLRALLNNQLVKKETADEMFRPQLDVRQARYFEKLSAEWGGALAVEFPLDMELNHGLVGCINMRDVPGKRKKGSLQWSGMCNSHWWLDRETGVAAVLIVQSQPHAEPVVTRLYNDLERAVYGGLLKK
ncbi:beta-lactamase [Colletotrichum orchidophilum]|uniref:Beta-lactamase n=1 Tax=Colletotrichum orchidophilum TaxID=1209926 RepID=A0A1G4B0Q6_9PEZI|nr:beta-lactamase [Colletotrichum orchidophilum]OHE94974.1 beta-lactamase [Colletotrichum orchidophilum]